MYPSVQLNEHLKRFLPACSRGMTPAKLAKALSSPYLTYTAPTDEKGFSEEDAKAIGLMADDGVMRAPFPMFRFCTEAASGVQMLGFCERAQGAFAVVSFFRRKEMPTPEMFYSCTFVLANPFAGTVEYDGRIWDAKTLKDISEEIKYSTTAPDIENDEDCKAARALLAVGGKENVDTLLAIRNRMVADVTLREKRLDNMRTMVDEADAILKRIITGHDGMLTGDQTRPGDMFMAYYCAVSIICYEYLAPQNFHAIVRPNTPGKSVEWLKAREHYTLIHRGHPANNANLKEGATITPDLGKLLTRCAHSRRAHTRLLRSTKFRFKIGQRVAVRATWCGPKQWQDSAGQTYQILIPVIPSLLSSESTR